MLVKPTHRSDLHSVSLVVLLNLLQVSFFARLFPVHNYNHSIQPLCPSLKVLKHAGFNDCRHIGDYRHKKRESLPPYLSKKSHRGPTNNRVLIPWAQHEQFSI